MATHSLRFAVTDEHGNRAATWKIWARAGVGKHDVYLACRSLGGKLKASLHQSGSWHIGFVRSFLREELEDDHPKRSNPYIENWERPPEIAPGVTLAYRILVPTCGVTVPITDSIPSSMIWIPAAPKGKAVEIDVLLTAPDVNVSAWPGRRSMKTKLAGKFVLDNSETVWVVHRVDSVPQFTQKAGNVTRFKSSTDVSLSDGDLRAIVIGKHEDGSRFMIDCALDTPANAA